MKFLVNDTVGVFGVVAIIYSQSDTMNESIISQETPTNTCVLPTRLPSSIHPAVDYVQASVVLVTMVLGISTNAYVVFLVGRYKMLQKMAFFLTLQIIVAHLIFSCTVLPFMFVTSLLGEWRLGDFMCQFLGSIHDLVITSRYLLTLVWTMDRVISVFCPFFHMQHGGKVAIGNSVLSWIFSVVRVVTSLRGVLNCTNYVPAFKMCSGAPFCSSVCQAHTVFFATVLAVFGVVIPFFLYVMLFLKANVTKRKIRKLFPKPIQVAPISVSVSSEPTATAANVEEVHVDRSESVHEGYAHNNRAAITFLILTAVIIGCALPPYIIYVVQNILGANSPPIVTILQIIVGRTLIYSLAAADPIIIMRNRDVREVIRSKMCGFGD